MKHLQPTLNDTLATYRLKYHNACIERAYWHCFVMNPLHTVTIAEMGNYNNIVALCDIYADKVNECLVGLLIEEFRGFIHVTKN